MITGEELLSMSKHDIYKKYCEVCDERDKIIERERQRLENELTEAKAELLNLQMRNVIMNSYYGLDPMAAYKGRR